MKSTKITSSTGRSQSQHQAFRGVMPNKKPIFVRVFPEETVLPNDIKTPHSPLAIVNPSIIPAHGHGGKLRKACLKTQTFMRSSSINRQKPQIQKRLINGGLSYKTVYESQNYHIIHEKGALNSHHMSI